jgi:hypothetical protein
MWITGALDRGKGFGRQGGELKAEFIEDFLVLGVEDVPDELVVDAEAVLEVGGLEDRVAELLAELSLNGAHDGEELPLLDVVTHDEHIDPGVGVMEEDAGGEDELDRTGGGDTADNLLLRERSGIDEEVSDRGKVAVAAVQAVGLTPLLDKSGLNEIGKLLSGPGSPDLGATGNFGRGEREGWVEDKETHNLHLRLGTEYMSDRFLHVRIVH